MRLQSQHRTERARSWSRAQRSCGGSLRRRQRGRWRSLRTRCEQTLGGTPDMTAPCTR